MIVSSELIGIFFAGFREMGQMAAINPAPVLWAAGLVLGGFLYFHFIRWEKTGAAVAFFFEKIEKKGLLAAWAGAGAILFLPLVFGAESRKILIWNDPFSAFFYANFKEKFILAKNSAAFRPLISDPNVPQKPPENFNKKNVIIICLDALRADRLAAYGGEKGQMPHLDSLISEGFFHKIDHGVSNGTSTLEGIYSMLFSNFFAEAATPTDRPGLPWLLRWAGYDAHFLLAGIHRGWYGLGNFYTQEATTLFEGLDSENFNPNDDRILGEGLEKLTDFNQKPAFFYVHMMSSHVAGSKLEKFRLHQPDTYDLWATHTQTQVDAYKNHYQNGVQQADWMLFELLSKFEKKGFLQNSIVWVFADHGESLGEHGGLLGHSEKPWREIMRIPMLFHDPDTAALANLQFATLTDIAPTTAARLGLPIPQKWVGKSLTEPFSSRQIHINGKESDAWVRIGAGYFEKYGVNWGDTTRYFFDLNKDPSELQNLWPNRRPIGWEGIEN